MAMIDPTQLARLTERRQQLEEEMALPGATTDRGRMRALLGEHKLLKRRESLAGDWLRLHGQLEEARGLALDEGLSADLREMARSEILELEARLPEAEQALREALLPPDPADERGVVLEIRAGTGGDEAAIFAGDLFRMYHRFAEDQGWTCRIQDDHPSELGGFKEIIATLDGEGVYRILKYESGVHRVQRIPSTETQGRIHTSAATVAVFPEADESDEITLAPEDIRIDIYRASGAGGQHVNKTDSAIRITHLPTGMVVQCQDERSQNRNREKALRILQARLLDQQRQEEEQRRAGARRIMVGSGDRSERIRTYNYPQNRITDHRIGLTVYALDRVMDGGLELLAAPLRKHDMEARLSVHFADPA